ncbi:hypothetical protein ACFFOP_27955 [Sinosporangium siamense]
MTAPLLVALVDPALATAKAPPRFRVGPHRGSPCLFVNDVPRFPMYLFEQEISAADAPPFEFFSFIEKTSFLDLGWTGPGQQDFTVIDRVMRVFAEHAPSGYALPRLHLWAPSWWLDTHPGDVVDYAITPGTAGIPRDASFASLTWRQEAGAMLRSMVRHLLDGPEGRRVMGVTIAGGLYGEWLCYNAEYLPDTSEAMRRAWIADLREKYGDDVTRLRSAWNDPAATFSGAAIPTAADRRARSVGLFRDPATSQRVLDYYETYHRVTAEAIAHFARIVKDESGGRLLVSVLYGYSPDQGYLPQEQHHRAVAELHRIRDVDMVTSPHSYYRRAPGDDGAFRTYTESLALHGKLFIDEADDRTHLAPPGTSFVYATTMAESLGLVRRAFGQAVTHACGMWYMDHSSGLWYADPAFGAEFTRLNRWGDYSLNLPRQRVSEVAVISVPTAEFALAGDTDTTAKLYEGPSLTSRQGLGELSKAGAPFDRYVIDDLVEGRVPGHYKVYVFPDAFRLDAAQRAAIAVLKSAGRTLVWGWAPGYADRAGLSKADVESLTGFDLDLVTASGGPPPDPSAPLDVEDFESGTYNGTGYHGPGTIVSGEVHGSAPSTTDWHEFLFSKPSDIPLEANAGYRVRFSARTLTAPGAGAYFYFLARTASGGVPQDVGVHQWTDSGTKEFEFTLKNFTDYYLIWGVHNGGGVAVDDIVVTKIANAGMPPVSYRLDPVVFPGDTATYGGEIALDPLFHPTGTGFTTLARSTGPKPRPVIAGKAMNGWTSVLASAPPLPVPVLRKVYADAGVWLYTDGGDGLEVNASWISLHAATTGTKTIRLPRPEPVYDTGADRLVGTGVTTAQFTLNKGDTLLLTRSNPLVRGGVRFDFETGDLGPFTQGPGGTGNGITQTAVVSGRYSAYGTAERNVDRCDVLCSDPAHITLEPRTKYRVEFSAKASAAPGPSGHFYFLVRSQDAGPAGDVGVTRWRGPLGRIVTRSVTFTTGDRTDYRLIWGMHLGGALSIDDITIARRR